MTGDPTETGDPKETDAAPRDGDQAEAEPTVERLHDHLAATRDRPVERDAGRWLGEAEAVVADLAGEEVPEGVLERRLGHVRDLLANVDDTQDAEADREAAAAKRVTAALLAELERE